MKQLLLALLLCLSILPSARADDYDDRAKLARERQNQETVSRYWNNVYASNVRNLRDINGFINRNGGLVQDGTCQMMTASCRELGGYGPMCSGGDYVQVPFSQIDVNAAYYFISCRVSLGNGLACNVSRDYLNDGSYNASCFDANGNARELKFGSGAARPARAKAKRKK
jgi:hypothetical protein